MPDPTTTVAVPRMPRTLGTELFRLVGEAMQATRQRRTGLRLAVLTVSTLLALGRHTISQCVLVVGAGELDWTAWYRLFNRQRVRMPVLYRQVVGRLLAELGPDDPLIITLDATQLPRSSRRFPGVGWTRSFRSPHWMPGLHLSQRISIMSGLLPQGAGGYSRAVPIREQLLLSARSRPVPGVPCQTEAVAGVRQLRWLRMLLTLGFANERDRPLLVLADGAYSVADVLCRLPRACTLVARCAKNRALFALPEPQPGRGRKRLYGPQGPSPHATLTTPQAWQTVRLQVRGRRLALRVTVTGPWVVRLASAQPVMLVVIRGVQRSSGASTWRRDATYLLVTARQSPTGTWELPYALPKLLAWFWHRWDVEVMHRELKSSCGFGDQQAWSANGSTTTRAWALWTYALLVLATASVWGLGPPPGRRLSHWYHPKHWSIGHALQALRAELWQMDEFHPVWARAPDTLAEMTTWMTTQTNATLAHRHI